MGTNSRIALALTSLLVVAVALYDLRLWQPERQDWKRFSTFLSTQYHDRWGHDKTFTVRETSEVLRQFFALTIEREEVRFELANDRAMVAERLKLEGNGTAIAQFARQEVNRLREPFVFEWTRQSWKPWDWQLTRADNAQLRVGEWQD
jgi:hypothetical protein